MKRSEVIRRLEGVVQDGDSEATIRYEARLVSIAEALGVPVEPDEPPLPDVLNYRDSAQEWGVSDATGDYDLRMTVARSSLAGYAAHGRLAWAMCRAYNERPRWRTGTPPEGGKYLVKDCEGRIGYAVYGAAGWLADVVAWMPPPEFLDGGKPWFTRPQFAREEKP